MANNFFRIWRVFVALVFVTNKLNYEFSQRRLNLQPLAFAIDWFAVVFFFVFVFVSLDNPFLHWKCNQQNVFVRCEHKGTTQQPMLYSLDIQKIHIVHRSANSLFLWPKISYIDEFIARVGKQGVRAFCRMLSNHKISNLKSIFQFGCDRTRQRI